mgnify:CR=1 FL=1
MKSEENKVVKNTEQQNAPSLKEILKAEEAELKAKQKAEKLKKKQKVAYDINGKVIPDLNVKHVRGIESKKSWYGFYFVLPWIIGMVLFFIIPLINSLRYSFANVIPEEGYMQLDWVGLEHYVYLFKKDENFTTNLLGAVGDFFTSMPIVVIVSLILALILNSNFKGKTLSNLIPAFIPNIIKINKEEFLETFYPETFGQENLKCDIIKLQELICQQSQNLENIIIVTDGANDTILSSKGKCFIGKTEKISVKNTIGCGDSFNAGFLYEFLKSQNLEKALKMGTFAASRNAESLAPGSIL